MRYPAPDMTELLSGSVLAQSIREKAAARVKNERTPPGLAVVLVGDNAASALYVGLKEKAAKDVGIYVEKRHFETSTTKELVALVKELNSRNDIHGILVQLPLPQDIDTDAVINTIHPTKDVDGFHPENRQALLNNEPLLVPPVALGVMRLIQSTRQPLINKVGVIVGNSTIFAEPVIELLKDAGVTAQFVDGTSAQAGAMTRAADIVILAVGKAGFLTKDMVKEGAIVIDVGTNRTPEGKVIGDAAPNLIDHVAFLSTVPGGVGPLTVAYLLMNVIKAKEVQERNAP